MTTAQPAAANSTRAASTVNRAQRERILTLTSRTIGLIVLLAGVAVLVGWQFELPLLKSIAPHFATMKANTALAFVLSGALLLVATHSAAPANYTEQRLTWIARGIAVTVAILGVATLIEYVWALDFGIDQLLFADPATAPSQNPGRMAPSTAVNFSLFGAAYLLLDVDSRGRARPAQWLALLIFANAYLAVMGYIYNVASLYRVAAFTSVAIHTAVLFVLLALGILTARPTQGFMRIIVSDGAGAILLRRLLPVAFVLPPIVDWLQTQPYSPHGVSFGVVLVATGNVVVLVALAWWTANSIRVAEVARREAETNVRASQERLGIALHAAGGGAWDWDLITNVAWWSPEMYELWGVAPGTVMQLDNSIAVVHEQDREVVRKSVETAIATHSPYHCEFRVSGTSPDERWMASRGSVSYDPAGNAVRMFGITLDISAQKRAELLLLQANEALERSNIDLQRFAHAASHDLQTPMRTVASFVELLQLKYADRLDDKGRDWLRRIVQSVGDLQALVRDLLQYSRVESQVRPFTEIDMRAVFDRTVLLLDTAIRESNAQVTCGDLPRIVGDATQLAELLLNLIGNALKYRGSETPRVHVAAQHIGNEWHFSVRDNGIGIEPRHHERIFEVFERLHNQQQYPGTGIGLAICRRVTQHHGGRIWVESEPNRGSTFYFAIPDRTVGTA